MDDTPVPPPIPIEIGRFGRAERGRVHELGADAADCAEFTALFRTEYEPMVRLAFVILASNALAEDVVQEAFARVHRRWPRIENPGGYLRRTVVHGCYDLLRRRKVERRFAVSPDATASHEPTEYLADALAVLPPKQRIALVLRFYGQLTEREIASAMDCPPGTVKTLLHRGKAALKEVIER